MNTSWHYRDDRYKYGPLTWEQLLSAARAGRLKPHHLVSQDEANWVSAESVPEIFAASPEETRPTAQASAQPPEIAPTMQWDIGSSDTVPQQDNQSLQFAPTMQWDITSGDSSSGGSGTGKGSSGDVAPPGGGSDEFDIFEEPGSAGSSGSSGAGATRIVRRLSPGSLLGNYKILETLGEGGMGTVLKARHVRMDRLVALKILRTQSTRPSGAVMRFHQEVRAASKLIHPNIVTAYDADEVQGVHFLVMEYVEGCDLDELLKERKRLPYKEAVGYVRQVAMGLAYAHGEGVVHRDVKPGNLIVDKRQVVKILDMGLASIKETATDQARQRESHHVTQADQILGTFDYMPPEQAVDARSADHLADIYSLGCTLFKLVTGESPYSGTTTMQKILSHREHPIPMMSKFCPEVPFDLDAVFGKMVAKDPRMRYQSMQEVISDLEACIDSKPISAWQTGSWGDSATGDSHLALSDEKLFIEPPSDNADDDLNEYMLSPLADEKEKKQPKSKQSDTERLKKQETKKAEPRWYWRVMGDEIGPLTMEELKAQNINTWDEVRRDDQEQWTVAQDVEGLF